MFFVNSRLQLFSCTQLFLWVLPLVSQLFFRLLYSQNILSHLYFFSLFINLFVSLFLTLYLHRSSAFAFNHLPCKVFFFELLVWSSSYGTASQFIANHYLLIYFSYTVVTEFYYLLIFNFQHANNLSRKAHLNAMFRINFNFKSSVNIVLTSSEAVFEYVDVFIRFIPSYYIDIYIICKF